MGAGSDGSGDGGASARDVPPAADGASPSSNEINLVIDSGGRGTFHIATRGTCRKRSHLTFDIRIDEASQRYLIHTSMGRLDKIRHIHPGMNILRTLSYWNSLQRKRYGGGGNGSGAEDGGSSDESAIRGGQLGIVAKSKRNMVMMTLMGEYAERRWEYDSTFQAELERFVEDALQFHLCLNGDGRGGGDDELNGSEHGGSTRGGLAGRDGVASPRNVSPRSSGAGHASSSSSGGSSGGEREEGTGMQRRAKGKLSRFLHKIH